MASNNKRPGGKRPNSPRYSDRYGPGHVNPYMGAQPGQSPFIREMEERHEAARRQSEQELARRQQASEEAAHTAPDDASARTEAPERRETVSARPEENTVRAQHSADTSQPRIMRDPNMRERLRQIRERAIGEGKSIMRGDEVDFGDLDFLQQPADVRLRLSDDNQPMIALETEDDEGNKTVRWVPVVLSEKEMETFFPALEPGQKSKGIEVQEEIKTPAEEMDENRQPDEPSVDELVLIPITADDDAESLPAAEEKSAEQAETAAPEEKASQPVPGAGLAALLAGLPTIEAEPEPEPDSVRVVAAVPVIEIVSVDDDDDEDDDTEPDNQPEDEADEDTDGEDESAAETDDPDDAELTAGEESPVIGVIPSAADAADDAETADGAESEPEADEDTVAQDEPEPPQDSGQESSVTEAAEESGTPAEEAEDTAADGKESAADDAAENDTETDEKEPADPFWGAASEPEDISDEHRKPTDGTAADEEQEQQKKEKAPDRDGKPRPKRKRRPRPDGEPRQDRAAETAPTPEPVIEPEPEPEPEPETAAPRRTAVAVMPLYYDSDHSSDDEDNGDPGDRTFTRVRKAREPVFPMHNGATLPKYINDDDFVERWLGDEEEEDLASQKKNKRRKIASFIGAATMILALIGFIAVAKWGIGLLRNIGGSESQKDIYGEYISSVVMSEVPVFETWDAIPQDKLLQSAVFTVLMDNDVTYERDDTGKFIVPSTDIVNAVKELYGAQSTDSAQDEEINTQIRNALYGSAGEDVTNEDAYYVDMEDSFHVADNLSGPAPNVTDISKRDNTVTLRVEYMEDLETGAGGILYTRQVILNFNEDGSYYVKAIREQQD